MELPHTVRCVVRRNFNPDWRLDSKKADLSVAAAAAASPCGLVNHPSAASELNTETRKVQSLSSAPPPTTTVHFHFIYSFFFFFALW